MNNILITGGAGFIGSNFIPYFINKYPGYKIINLDKLTYAGDLKNLKEIENHPRYKFIKGDICDRGVVESIFKEYDIQGVIHFAAESHVDNSITNPEIFIRTNINGTLVLIDTAKNYWGTKDTRYENCKFLHISTDEVYGELEYDSNQLFTETTPYSPSSPYSASKASSDMIVKSYHRTFGINCVITNCSNNYGPKQHDEKLIPTIIRNAIQNRPIPIYGDGQNIRDWIYVLDHCKGIDLAYHKGKRGETYNIGGKNEKTNLQIATMICEILDEKIPLKNSSLSSYKDLIIFTKDRAGHDKRYAIDALKIEKELGWTAEESLHSGMLKTIDWYLKKYNNI